MKQFNARLDEDTISLMSRLTTEMAEARGLPRPLSQADVLRMAIKLLAEKELVEKEKKAKEHKR